MTTRDKKITGTREWATKSVNCCLGCQHGCLYCYARQTALRWKWITSAEDWITERIRYSEVTKRRGLLSGTVMFPTTHDITPGNVGACGAVLDKLLDAGNRVLIVSKPHPEIIAGLCDRYRLRREQILFRFSIGAVHDDVRKFWEPGAPPIWERIVSLAYAHAQGFATSVSAEPLLEPDRAAELVAMVAPYVTDSIWIGKCNGLRQRTAWALAGQEPMLCGLEAWQSDDRVREVYAKLADHPVIRWKDSYKKVVGLQMPTTAGLDI